MKRTDALVTKGEAARLLGVSRQWVWKLIKAGKLTAITIAGIELLLRSEVEQIATERGSANPAISKRREQ